MIRATAWVKPITQMKVIAALMTRVAKVVIQKRSKRRKNVTNRLRWHVSMVEDRKIKVWTNTENRLNLKVIAPLLKKRLLILGKINSTGRFPSPLEKPSTLPKISRGILISTIDWRPWMIKSTSSGASIIRTCRLFRGRSWRKRGKLLKRSYKNKKHKSNRK